VGIIVVGDTVTVKAVNSIASLLHNQVGRVIEIKEEHGVYNRRLLYLTEFNVPVKHHAKGWRPIERMHFYKEDLI
jgi:hypothetical protein